MSGNLRRRLARLWSDLNPKEPSAGYLARFYLAAVVIFAFALLIGWVFGPV